MKLRKYTHFFVFDCESIGLHGDTFAVAGGVWNSAGEIVRLFYGACDPATAQGGTGNRLWVRNNVPALDVTQPSPSHLREYFWNEWLECKKLYADVAMFVECGWPVEARFLAACVDDNKEGREFQGPYPLHEIASFMAAAGMDPMASYTRLPAELPCHDPRADARLSARLLIEALKKLS